MGAQEDAERFVRAWQESTTIAEVVRKTGLKIASVRSKATKYRKAGVPLKEIAPETSRLDYARLTEIAQGLKPQPPAPR